MARSARPDVALVLRDGLSAIAVSLNSVALMTQLAARLAQDGQTCGPVILTHQARVALGDGVARTMGAQSVVIVLGERPGLSAADGLDVYVTQNPQAHTPDRAGNCLSNVRAEGFHIPDAVSQAYNLVKEMRGPGRRGLA